MKKAKQNTQDTMPAIPGVGLNLKMPEIQVAQDMTEEFIGKHEDTVPTVAGQDREAINEAHDFYTADIDKTGQVAIKLDKLRIIKILRKLGYLRYDTPDGQMRYVYAHDHKLKLTNQTQIIDAFEDYIKQLPNRQASLAMPSKDATTYITKEITPYKILEVLYNSDMGRYFSIIDRLRPEYPIEIMQDERYVKYLFFNNTAVAVSADGAQMIEYKDLEDKGFIWESNIVNRDFHYTETIGDFERFCMNISQDKDNKTDRGRFVALQSIMGYLMHDYFETDLKAIFFTDVAENSNNQAAGRTGKGLLGKALSQVLNRDAGTDNKYVSIPGKGFSHDEGDGTCYAAADITTQLIHIEDIDRRFDFEALYGDVTDGAKIRKKMQNPVRKNIKFMISSNRTIKTSGSSTKGRLCIFELTNYYNDKFRPINDFGRRFFESDWKQADWDQFYSFICRCIEVYFREGLIEPKSVNYDRRQLEERFMENKEFLYFWDDAIRDITKRQARTELVKVAYYERFKQENQSLTWLDQKKFTGWCKDYMNIAGIPFAEKRSTKDLFILYPDPQDYPNNR